MLNDDLKARIEAATVSLTKKKGRGVLVASNLVLTVAHCLDFSCEFPMAYDTDFYLEDVSTSRGNFRLTPYAVEPCHDIAALGELDGQQPAFEKDVEMFEAFCEEIEGVPLCLKDFELREAFSVHVFTHEGNWVSGTARQFRSNTPGLLVEFDEVIKGGTSGSPIVNDAGELVALVSTIGFGASPRPYPALPVWIIENIRSYYA